MSEPTGQRLGRYRLVRRIAKGGMAEVYLARSQGARGFEKTVAIKRILPRYSGDEQFVNMMVDEAKITVLLNHPNIAQIIEFGEADGSYFIVMEYVPGQSLSALNKRLKKRYDETMGVLEASFIVVEMLQGLHVAHTQKDRGGKPANIIHRDVSPQNCLISYDGVVKLIDFGIAKARDRIERTQVGTIKGKLRYLAPEMIDPGRFGVKGQFDHRVDVFAAGIVLFELVAGRQLFEGENEYDVYKNITDGKVPDLAKEGICDEALMRILERALAKHAGDRYATAEDFADDLRAFLYRSDPSFKSQRIQTLMDRCFEEEKEALAAVEAEEDSQFSEVPQELTFARRAESEVNRTRASRRRGRTPSEAGSGSGSYAPKAPEESTEDDKSSPPHKPSLSELGAELGVNPSAATQMVSADHLAAIQGGGGAHSVQGFDFDDQTAALSEEQEAAAASRTAGGPEETRIAVSEPFDDLDTPATSTQRIPKKVERGTRWAWVIAAASIFGVLLAVGGVLLTEVLLKGKPQVADAEDGDGDVQGGDEGNEPAGAALTKVELTFKARPDTATVRIGKGEPEAVPVTIEVDPGAKLRVTLEAPGHKSLVKDVEVPGTPGRKTVSYELEPEPVEIAVNVNAADARVRVDGETYWEGQKVMPGERIRIEVSADGYRSLEKTVTAKAGEELVVDIELERVPEAGGPVVANDPAGDEPPDRAEPTDDEEDDAKPRAGGKKRRGPTKKVTKRSDRDGKDKVEKREPKKRASKTDDKASGEKGVLKVKAIPYWGRVTVDGRELDDTTPVRVKLSPGVHKVTVTHPPKGLVERFEVEIQAGETIERTVNFQ